MNLDEKRSNVKQQLDTFYEVLRNDLKNSGSINSVKNIFDKEYSRVALLAESLQEELVYEAKVAFRSRENEAGKLEAFLEGVQPIGIKPCHCDYSKGAGSQVYVNTVRKAPPAGVSPIPEKAVIGAIAGGISGGVIGGGAASIFGGPLGVIGGAAIGLVAGVILGAAVGYTTNGRARRPSPVRTNPGAGSSSGQGIDKSYFLQILKKRLQENEGLLLGYIDRFEQELLNL